MSSATMSAVAKRIESAVRRWPTERARRWACDALPPLAEDARVLAILVVGSAVRPVDESHDVDFIVIRQGDQPTLARPPLEVDVRFYDADRVAGLLRARHDYLLWAVRFGIVVHERSAYWSQLRAIWGPRHLLPDAALADERRRDAESRWRALQASGDADAAAEQHVMAMTHGARAILLRAGVFPASRPELAAQLRAIGEERWAREIELALEARRRRRIPT